MTKRLMALLLFLAVGFLSGAQGQIQTKKFRFSDFREKTIKVVLTGNDMMDALMREGVKKSWYLSPYEFCDLDSFADYMADDSNYFLIMADSRFHKESEAGVVTVSILKGSPKASVSELGLKGLDKVTSIPICPSDDSEGRAMTFLPLMLCCLQNNVEAIMSNEINIGSTVKVRAGKKDWSVPVYIDSCDLAFSADESAIETLAAGGVNLCSSDDIDEIVSERRNGCLVGYSVAPEDPEGHKCFIMLFEPSSAELYMMESVVASKKKVPGFTRNDIDFILSRKK